MTATQLLLAGMRGEREKFREILQRFSEIKPSDANLTPLFLAGDTSILAADFSAAARFCREVLETSPFKNVSRKPPRLQRAQLKLACALRQLGQSDEAARLLQEAASALDDAQRFALLNRLLYPINGLFYTDVEIYALRGEKEKSLAALQAALALPDDGFIAIGSLPVPIEDSPFLESLRDTPGFAVFRQEAARRRAVMHDRVAATRARLGSADE